MGKETKPAGRTPADWVFVAAAIGLMGAGTLAIVTNIAATHQDPAQQSAGFGFAAIASESEN